MKPEEFVAEDWIERLAHALSELAEGHETALRKYHGLSPDIHLLFGGPEGERHTYSPNQVWDHFARQTGPGRWNWVPGRVESPTPKAQKPDGVRNILLAHPTLSEASDWITDRDEFWMQGLGTGRPTSPTDLIAGLMARAAELSGDRFRAAAGELNALLAPVTGTGPAHVSTGPNVGCDVVLFYGLTLEEESDLADGMAIVPFEHVKAFVDEEVVQELAPAGAEVHGWRSVGGIVRPFRWNPSFHRTSDLEDAGLKPPGRFFQEARTFLELISVAHGAGAPVLRLAELPNCIDRSAAKLLGLERRGPGLYGSGSAHEFDGSADRPRLAREALNQAREAFGNRTTGHHKAMAPIVSRLAEAQARSGRFAGDDMILDVAIALEQMYRPEGSEIAHKMRTRVAWYLGTDAESRLRYMKATKEFYDMRSKIVHGGKKEVSAERRLEAFATGFDIARRTLFKRLRAGPPGDWDELVVAGNEP